MWMENLLTATIDVQILSLIILNLKCSQVRMDICAIDLDSQLQMFIFLFKSLMDNDIMI